MRKVLSKEALESFKERMRAAREKAIEEGKIAPTPNPLMEKMRERRKAFASMEKREKGLLFHREKMSQMAMKLKERQAMLKELNIKK